MPSVCDSVGQILSDRTGHAPFFSRLEHSHTLVDIFHLLDRVWHAPGALSTPYIQEEDNPGSKCRELRGQQRDRSAAG